MSITRRGFLGSILALAAAPAIVRADALMRIVPYSLLILHGDGIMDDTLALHVLLKGHRVYRPDGTRIIGTILPAGKFYIPGSIQISSGQHLRGSL